MRPAPTRWLDKHVNGTWILLAQLVMVGALAYGGVQLESQATAIDRQQESLAQSQRDTKADRARTGFEACTGTKVARDTQVENYDREARFREVFVRSGRGDPKVLAAAGDLAKSYRASARKLRAEGAKAQSCEMRYPDAPQLKDANS